MLSDASPEPQMYTTSSLLNSPILYAEGPRQNSGALPCKHPERTLLLGCPLQGTNHLVAEPQTCGVLPSIKSRICGCSNHRHTELPHFSSFSQLPPWHKALLRLFLALYRSLYWLHSSVFSSLYSFQSGL